MSTFPSSKILFLTPGDPSGIGTEITAKSIELLSRKNFSTPIVCIGALQPFLKIRKKPELISTQEIDSVLKLSKKNRSKKIFLIPAPESSLHFLEGFQAGWSIQEAALLVLKYPRSALITGPISKERLQLGGFPYSGHTDFLSDICAKQYPKMPHPNETMMLANSQLRVTLVTTHISLRSVSEKITKEKVITTILNTALFLTLRFGIRKPRIAVCALNPHAGENGIFGDEDQKIITPAIEAAQKQLQSKAKLFGPLPSDTLFAKHIALPKKDRYDAIVCQYHDQGLIPVKLLDFPNTVNVTLGLPLIRTSVDHGTAFDIAGKGIADPRSMIAAIQLAKLFLNNETKGKHP